jgi:hypothetical protein
MNLIRRNSKRREIKMPRGGRRPGAGRKPGPSKRWIEVAKHLGPAGECAIAVLIDAMQNPFGAMVMPYPGCLACG